MKQPGKNEFNGAKEKLLREQWQEVIIITSQETKKLCNKNQRIVKKGTRKKLCIIGEARTIEKICRVYRILC